MLFRQENEGKKILLPVRVIMNNETITIFQAAHYEAVVVSYDIDYVQAHRQSFGNDDCLVLNDRRDNNKESTICVWRAALRNGEGPEIFIGKWIEQIEEFRDECKRERFVTDDDPEIDKMENIADMEEREDVKDEDDVSDKKEEQDAMQKLRDAVSMAEREMRYEELAMKDEKMLGLKQLGHIRDLINEHKEQEFFIDRQLTNSDDNPSIGSFGELSAEALAKEYVKQIKAARMRTYIQLSALRRSTLRRKKEKLAELTSIKARMASKLIEQDKIGDAQNCDTKNPPAKRIQWCESEFTDDEEKKEECLKLAESPSDYCLFCCKKEYGVLHLEMRKGCFRCCGADEGSFENFTLPPLGALPKECLNFQKSEGVPPKCLQEIVSLNRRFKSKDKKQDKENTPGFNSYNDLNTKTMNPPATH